MELQKRHSDHSESAGLKAINRSEYGNVVVNLSLKTVVDGGRDSVDEERVGGRVGPMGAEGARRGSKGGNFLTELDSVRAP